MTQIDWSNSKRGFVVFTLIQLKLLIIINDSIFFSITIVKLTNPLYLMDKKTPVPYFIVRVTSKVNF